MLSMAMNADHGGQVADNTFSLSVNPKDGLAPDSCFYSDRLIATLTASDQSAPLDANLVCQPDCVGADELRFKGLPLSVFQDTSLNYTNPLMPKHYVLIPSPSSGSLKSNVMKLKASREQNCLVRAHRRHLSAEKRYRESINSEWTN